MRITGNIWKRHGFFALVQERSPVRNNPAAAGFLQNQLLVQLSHIKLGGCYDRPSYAKLHPLTQEQTGTCQISASITQADRAPDYSSGVPGSNPGASSERKQLKWLLRIKHLQGALLFLPRLCCCHDSHRREESALHGDTP